MSDNEPNKIDEAIQEAEDTDIERTLVEYGDDSEDDSRLEFVKKWFPSEDDWRGKTRISAEQARALTVMRHLPEIYGEEILGEDKEDIKNLLNSLADNIEVYQTSMGGESRKEQKDILELAFGGQAEQQLAKENSMMDTFMQDIEDDD